MHEQFAKLATRLIDKNGQACQLAKVANSGDAWNPIQTEVLTDIIAVNIQIKNSDIDGNLIKVDDLMFLIDSSVEPKLSDKFIHDNKKYEIKRVKKLKPADTTILYKIQVRL